MIEATKKIWNRYEANFHLNKLKRDYPRMTKFQKLIASIFMFWYWINNFWFSLTVFPVEAIVIYVCNPTEEST